jgi:hypothetical protein
MSPDFNLRPAVVDDCAYIREDRDRWRQLCLNLYDIVTDEGFDSTLHKMKVNHIKSDWPVLWKQIESIVYTFEKMA